MTQPLKTNDTFNAGAFEMLRKAEVLHFWFCVRRKWIYDKIRKFSPPPSDLLEIGCGTGNVSSFLSTKGYQVTGCEFYPEALRLAWPGFNIIQADASALPFETGTFDIAGLFDVIEHLQDDTAALSEAARVLRPEGIMAVTVPAREELWSVEDERAMHKRRYSKKILQDRLAEVGLDIMLLEYIFMGLYLPMKYLRRQKSGSETGNEFDLSAIANKSLKSYFELERIISRILPLPIGTSLIAIARKKK